MSARQNDKLALTVLDDLLYLSNSCQQPRTRYGIMYLTLGDNF